MRLLHPDKNKIILKVELGCPLGSVKDAIRNPRPRPRWLQFCKFDVPCGISYRSMLPNSTTWNAHHICKIEAAWQIQIVLLTPPSVHPNIHLRSVGNFLKILRHNPGQMEDFSIKIRQISHGKYKQRFQNSGMICKSSDKSCHVSPDYPNNCASYGNYYKAGETLEDIIDLYVINSNINIGLKHMIKYLQCKQYALNIFEAKAIQM